MNNLLLGLFIFLGSHLFLRTPIAIAIKSKLNIYVFRAIFSILSLAGLIFIIMGYSAYRPIAPIIYNPPIFTKHINFLLMYAAFICLLATFIGSKIKAVLVHPMIIAIMIWSFGHLLANGDLASIILFGSFLIWAVIARFAQPKTEKSNAKWGRGDEGAIAFASVLWVAMFKWLHQIWFGVALI